MAGAAVGIVGRLELSKMVGVSELAPGRVQSMALVIGGLLTLLAGIGPVVLLLWHVVKGNPLVHLQVRNRPGS